MYYDGSYILPIITESGFRIDVAFPIEIGFHGDLNETYPVGRVDEDSIRLMRASRESLDAAIKICKPGALFRDIGKVMYVIVTGLQR